MNALKLRIFELPPIGTNAYLLLNESTGEAALFDAPFGAHEEVGKVLERAQAELTGVWLTHGHWDHMLDAHAFNASGIPVYGHREDERLINHPDRMAAFSIPGMNFQPARLDGYLEHGQMLTILGYSAEVRHVPGHSPGSVAFVFPDLKWVISGDVVFAGSVGRTDFPGCSHEVLMQSIANHILPLEDDYVLYPGHGPKTTIGKERGLNPFIRGY